MSCESWYNADNSFSVIYDENHIKINFFIILVSFHRFHSSCILISIDSVFIIWDYKIPLGIRTLPAPYFSHCREILRIQRKKHSNLLLE